MTDVQQTRQQVSQAYAQAVESESCCGGAAPKGVAAKLAGYDEVLLRELPADAVVNSFGCGNPVAFAEIAEGEVVLDLGSGAGHRPPAGRQEGRTNGFGHWYRYD